MTKLEIIEDTIKYYGENPLERRAVAPDDGTCFYELGETRCALGRYMLDAPRWANKMCGVFVLANNHGFTDEDLIPEARGHSLTFWADIQSLHDVKRHWDLKSGGLTETGLLYVNSLKKTYGEGN